MFIDGTLYTNKIVPYNSLALAPQTSDNDPYIVTASSLFSGFSKWNSWDNNASTYSLFANNTYSTVDGTHLLGTSKPGITESGEWTIIDLGVVKKLNRYTLTTTNNAAYLPASWNIIVSNDDVSYLSVDRKEEQVTTISTAYDYTLPIFEGRYVGIQIDKKIPSGAGFLGFSNLTFYEIIDTPELAVGEVNTYSSLGGDTSTVATKIGADLQFRGLSVGSSKVSLAQNTADIDIDVVEANIDHNALLNYDADQHRVINDNGTLTTELFSASKINTDLAAKANTVHTHTASNITDFNTAVDARISYPVSSVAGKTGVVALVSTDLTDFNTAVDARISYPVASVAGKTGVVELGGNDITYDNATSGLTATTVQSAIDEIDSVVDTIVASGGEANTSSSVGGTSLVLPKVGVDLPFKGLTATSTKIGITVNANDIGLDVVEANVNHDTLLNYDITQHRVINDSGTLTTELFSASKINTELATKANTNHTHVASNITDFSTATDARITLQKGAVNGLATLDEGGKVSASQLDLVGTTTTTKAEEFFGIDVYVDNIVYANKFVKLNSALFAAPQTSNVSPYTVSASSTFPTFSNWNSWDNNGSTYSLFANNTYSTVDGTHLLTTTKPGIAESGEWAVIDFGVVKRFNRYTLLTTDNANYLPASWNIISSNDNVTYTSVDKKEDLVTAISTSYDYTTPIFEGRFVGIQIHKKIPSASFTIGFSNLSFYEIIDTPEVGVINDAGVTNNDLWSADKIITQLDQKAEIFHTHTADAITDLVLTTCDLLVLNAGNGNVKFWVWSYGIERLVQYETGSTLVQDGFFTFPPQHRPSTASDTIMTAFTNGNVAGLGLIEMFATTTNNIKFSFPGQTSGWKWSSGTFSYSL
jgi:hypothetical protein